MRFAFAALLVLIPSFAYAQSTDLLGASAQAVPNLTIDAQPQNPQPRDTVVITPQSTLLDLSNSTITISVNGTQIYKGGAQGVPVTLGANGTVTTVSVTALSQGQTYSASISFDPGDVSLVEEPLTSAPPLYPGEPLVADSGSVRLVAMADFETSPGRSINPAALVYTWSQDGSTFDASSGIGKNALIVPAPLEYRDETIDVSVTSQDGSIVGSDSIDIVTQTPTLRLYAQDPLMGILYDHALAGSYSLTGSEASFVAVPYSFAIDNGPPTISWFLDGNSAQSGSAITLRPTGSGSGSDSVSATASAGQDTSSAGLSISYGSSSGGLFGL